MSNEEFLEAKAKYERILKKQNKQTGSYDEISRAFNKVKGDKNNPNIYFYLGIREDKYIYINIESMDIKKIEEQDVLAFEEEENCIIKCNDYNNEKDNLGLFDKIQEAYCRILLTYDEYKPEEAVKMIKMIYK